MSLEIVQAKIELRELVDAYANLTDEKKIDEQMLLFTSDGRYTVYVGESLLSEVIGTKQLGEDFKSHASEVKRYFSMNGQHVVKVDGATATGVVFSQIKMVRDEDGTEVITDYSVRYDDVYVCQNGTWLIKERTANFIIFDARPLQG
ncbi:nuclear transport factor 2 family protein [Paenibacillus medicaginis]|uniref:Nuclear transport factor 2 family protein n=1 Tax=Paenibacillus medicaginis TaxID=1470560 RepID=A0ABV5C3L4_9BACL